MTQNLLDLLPTVESLNTKILALHEQARGWVKAQFVDLTGSETEGNCRLCDGWIEFSPSDHSFWDNLVPEGEYYWINEQYYGACMGWRDTVPCRCRELHTFICTVFYAGGDRVVYARISEANPFYGELTEAYTQYQKISKTLGEGLF